jgi:hypothetical protein
MWFFKAYFFNKEFYWLEPLSWSSFRKFKYLLLGSAWLWDRIIFYLHCNIIFYVLLDNPAFYDYWYPPVFLDPTKTIEIPVSWWSYLGPQGVFFPNMDQILIYLKSAFLVVVFIVSSLNLNTIISEDPVVAFDFFHSLNNHSNSFFYYMTDCPPPDPVEADKILSDYSGFLALLVFWVLIVLIFFIPNGRVSFYIYSMLILFNILSYGDPAVIDHTSIEPFESTNTLNDIENSNITETSKNIPNDATDSEAIEKDKKAIEATLSRLIFILIVTYSILSKS